MSSSSEKLPLLVYIMAGQSNMQGHAHHRTLPHVSRDPKTAPLLDKIQTAEGKFRTCDNVYISVIGTNQDDEEERCGPLSVGYGATTDKLGPELLFGMTLDELHDHKRQILIIKTAWGGKSLHTDFRPPNAGPFEFRPEQLEEFGDQRDAKIQEKQEATGHSYRLMMRHVQHVLQNISRIVPSYTEEQGYQMTGFVWFQGWNDMVDQSVYPNRDQPDGYDEYSRLLTLLIQNIRQEWNVPQLPVVIGIMGVHGVSVHVRDANLHFRVAQELPVTRLKKVVTVRTEGFWDMQLAHLEEKLAPLQKKMKDYKQESPNINGKQQHALMQEWKQELLTPEELHILDTGKSNAGFHYFGSAKFFVQVGQAFAEAMYRFEAAKITPKEEAYAAQLQMFLMGRHPSLS